ncbi:hypothetical protein NPIL_521731, partial [Nephila pilipes]
NFCPVIKDLKDSVFSNVRKQGKKKRRRWRAKCTGKRNLGRKGEDHLHLTGSRPPSDLTHVAQQPQTPHPLYLHQPHRSLLKSQVTVLSSSPQSSGPVHRSHSQGSDQYTDPMLSD